MKMFTQAGNGGMPPTSLCSAGENTALQKMKGFKASMWMKVFAFIMVMLPIASKAQTYCTPTTDCGWDHIDNFTFNTIANNSTGCGNTSSGYTYYSGITTSVSKGMSYSLSMEQGGGFDQGFGVWIDYNKDGDFSDNGEFVYASPTAGLGVFSTTITIPSSAATGVTRLRVRNRYNNTLTSGESCTSFTYGETEDYNVNILASKPNDAGVTAVTSPTSPACSSTQDVTVTIVNQGSNQITGLNVNWSVDGVTQTQYNYTGTLDTFGGAGSTSASVTLGSVTLSSAAKVIKIWTSDPNSTTDPNQLNDTIVVSKSLGLSGTFTIGGSSSDFADVSAAVIALNSNGVCGPVTFNITAGTYTGRIVLNEINGTSATNTITFAGAGKASTSITHNGTSTANWQTILLNGADHVTFKNLMIEGTGSYGVGVMLTNSADYNTFSNCDINVRTTTTSTNVEGVIGSGSITSYDTEGPTGSYNTFENLNIKGGYYGVRFTGPGSTNLEQSNVFDNLNVTEYYYYGIYVYNNDNPKIINNNTTQGRNSSFAYGIYVGYCAGPQVIGNYIDAPGRGLYYPNNNSSQYNNVRGVVANNIIIAGGYYGIYASNGDYTDFFHNSVLAKTDYEGLYITSANDADVRNNILVTYSSGDPAIYASGTNFIGLDYNIYYAPNYDLAYHDNWYATLADWQAAEPQYNEHSYEMDPGYISNSNLHLNNTGVKPYGAELGISIDVDGDARCVFAPTIGADESLLGKSQTVTAEVFAPDTVFVNSPALFEGRYNQGSIQRNEWYIDDVLVKDSIDFTTIFTTAGQYEVKVVSRSCANVDADSVMITVYNPTSAPVADFIAPVTSIGQYETVSFMSLSEHGPSSLQWDISPAMTNINGTPTPTYQYVGGSSTSGFPVVEFLFPGKYEVCLTASNSIGTDQLCRTSYIEVLPKINLGSQNIIRSAKGYLYDDGGPTGSYSNAGSGLKVTGVLIDACASEIFLDITEFNLECGYDYLRVYDGSSNQGTPLFGCTTNDGPDGNGPGYTGPGCGDECSPVGTTLVATSGTMYIEMVSDVAVSAPGFEAYWWSTPKNVPAPVASIEGPDSVCRNSVVRFNNTSTGSFASYKWDFDGDLTTYESQDSVSADWAFVITGTQTITLIAENCGGIDTLTQTVTVYDPQTPAVTFKADNLSPTPTDIVTFTPTLSECVDKYKWTFTRSSGSGLFSFVNGTGPASISPMVTFNDTGCWDVQLWAENVTGSDSLVKTCYINVKENYCIPTVGTVVGDIGIANVKLNTIDKSSSQGQTSYSNFVNTDATNLEIGVTYDLIVSRTSNSNNITYAAWIDWNQDGDFNDIGEEVGRLANTSSKSWTEAITIPIIAKEGPTVMRIGVSRGSGTNTPCGQNAFGEFEDYRVIVSEDQTSPVITLYGSADTMVEQGRTYVEPGYIAIDNLSGNITPDVTYTYHVLATGQQEPNLNTYVVRDYEIRYVVEDGSGNIGTASRIVRVFADTTRPVLDVAPNVQLSVDVAAGTYTTPAVTKAEDNIDGTLTSNVLMVSSFDPNIVDTVQVIDEVDPTVVDTYTVSYYIIDAAGNETTVTRIVIIYDDVEPVLTLNGDDTVVHQIGASYTDLGYSVSDNYYPEADLRLMVTSSTDLNINKFGIYRYTYILTDPSGNGPVSVTRIINVTDTILPQIALVGRDSVVIDVNEPYNDPGVKVSDNYGIEGLWTAGGEFYDMFPDGVPTVVGVYTITYSIEDLAGNIVTIDRKVSVVDRVAPNVELVGGTVVNICRFSSYSDSGYIATDNYNSVAELNVDTSGSWYTDYLVTGLPGTYSIIYNVSDSSGNTTSVLRTVSVLPKSDLRCEGVGIADAELEKNITLYPNPNNGMFTVKANLPEMKQVRMSILNMMGQEIAIVAEGMMQSGVYSVDLSTQASGVYFLKVTTDNHSFTKQVLIAR